MPKHITILILSLLIFQSAQAQKDTTIYYMKNNGGIVPEKDSADYVRYVMPADSLRGVYYYKVAEIYPNGYSKLEGITLNNSSKLLLTGKCIRYYPNGHIKNIINYYQGVPVNAVTAYYPNGKLYITGKFGNEDHTYNHKLYIAECRDSTGKVLATNGEGQWVKYDDDFKSVLLQGPVNKGVENGQWTFFLDGKPLNFVYKKGEITTPINYDQTGTIYTKTDIPPVFKDELGTFDRFVMKNVKYPSKDILDNTGGKVVVSFVVEVDGSLSNIKVLSAPSVSLGDAAVAVLKLSPQWQPAYVSNKPVRAATTYPFRFSVGERK